uniref:Apolipoprotein D n=1 Tax=Haplochromis burtoni TaxID=8153 RepID=A0A3Q3C2M4_HAPBU
MKPAQVVALTLLSVVAIGAQVLRLGKCPQPAVQANFDGNRYIGKWYEIHKLPTSFQKGQCATANYTLLSPGVIEVLNTDDNGTVNAIVGSAKVKNPAEPSNHDRFKLSSRPLLGSDYDGHSLVYGCTNYGLFRVELSWILSRKPTLSKETLEKLQGILYSVGISVENMVPTNQDET